MALVVAAAAVGWLLPHRGEGLYLDAPPLLARVMPHWGPGTPVAVTLAALGAVWAPRLALTMRWRPLLLASWAGATAWTASLALVDGWQRGIAGRLDGDDEYLHDLPRVEGLRTFLGGFESHIVGDGEFGWTTHVSSHPPGALLVFWMLDRAGLAGGVWAAVLVIAVGSSAGVAVAVAVSGLGARADARRALPLLVFFPGAVWVGVSADGLFGAVCAWGLAFLVLGIRSASRLRAVAWSLAGGASLGLACYLSYGLALFAIVVTAAIVAALAARSAGSGRPSVVVRPMIWAVTWALTAAGAVAALFTWGGFDWLAGLRETRVRYYAGVASTRSIGYFAWANIAALAIMVGPFAFAGLARAVRLIARSRTAAPAVALLAAGSSAAVLIADVTGMSKGETERIWLPFGIWLVAGTALLPARARSWALRTQLVLALAVNHFLLTRW